MNFWKKIVFLSLVVLFWHLGDTPLYGSETLENPSPQSLSGKTLIGEKKPLVFTGKLRNPMGATGSTSTGRTSNETEEEIGSGDDNKKKIDEKERQEIREEINELILDSIMKKSRRAVDNFSAMIEERYSSKEEKIDAYKRIQRTLELRIKKIEENENLKENGKFILKEYLSSMISLLDKKIEELE